MKYKNKKAFTLIEMITVISILLILLGFANNFLGRSQSDAIAAKIMRDFLSSTLSEISDYSFNNKTVSQELLNGNGSVNTAVSRLDNKKASLNHQSSKVAFYHGLYLTTQSNDTIDQKLAYGKNGYFYLLQYRQEGYISIDPKVLTKLTVNPETSPELLKFNYGLKWSKRYQFPVSKELYLLKILNVGESCQTGINKYKNITILFSSGNLNYKFYKDGILDKKFDYKLCFSEDSTRMTSKIVSFRINRNNLFDSSETIIR